MPLPPRTPSAGPGLITNETSTSRSWTTLTAPPHRPRSAESSSDGTELKEGEERRKRTTDRVARQSAARQSQAEGRQLRSSVARRTRLPRFRSPHASEPRPHLGVRAPRTAFLRVVGPLRAGRLGARVRPRRRRKRCTVCNSWRRPCCHRSIALATDGRSRSRRHRARRARSPKTTNDRARDGV
jgi:hypothetical protein